MESVIQDIYRDFGEVRENLDSLDTTLSLLNDLAKQKEIVIEGYFVENSNHGNEHCDVHSSNFDDGVSAKFKKALQKYLKKRQLHMTWEGFNDELLKRFSTGGIENPYEQLARLKQTS
ncbi:hypothetical protein CR513_52039, partial [Mucuna pruriens]